MRSAKVRLTARPTLERRTDKRNKNITFPLLREAQIGAQ